MESNIHSNFIPQDAQTPQREVRIRGGMFDLMTLLAMVIFVASAALAVGVFLYLQFLTTSAKGKLDQLDRAKQAFEPSLIADMTRLDDRMRAADEVLGSHVAPTALFHLLEQLTLQTVSFSAFSFTANGTDMELKMAGLARSVNSVALQADLMSKAGMITNPIFSNINRQDGGVHFDFSAKINPTGLSYRNIVDGVSQAAGAAGTQLPQLPQQPTSPFGTPGDAAPETPTQ